MQRVPLDVSRTKLARTKMKRFRFLQRSSPLYSGRMQVKRNRDVKPESNTSICINYCCSGSSVIVAQIHRLAFKVVVHTTRCPTDPFNQWFFCLAPEELASRRVFGRFSFSQEQASHHVGGYATQDGLKQAQEPFEFNYQLDRHCSKTIVSVINPFYKFNYQLDRHCSKTRMATSWRESSNTDATSDKAGYVGAPAILASYTEREGLACTSR